MNLKEAALKHYEKLHSFYAVRDVTGRSVSHAKWMLEEIIHDRVTGEKGHRWLGYAQSIMVHAEIITLEEAKLLNFKAKKGQKDA